ncbi:MAG: aminotransferase class I/II-fold pyridoxal phosphate-dependent enzyme [Clostridiales bacterium]|nr:aminotransferase class I/II-fold pyridoxal phosphate-dependent enzyme [Clostridiales bacterium]
MSRFLNEPYRRLAPYTPGEQPQDMKYVKLNTNESPYPPSPGVIKALDEAAVERLRLYPDPECTVLREKLAKMYGVKPENIYLSNGSDDILNFAFMALSGGVVRFPNITYGFYPVFADLHRVPYRTIPLRKDFTIDPEDYCHPLDGECLRGAQQDLGGSAVGSDGMRDGMVVIANPNAPTGLTLSEADIRRITEANPDRVVLIDEAYVDFGAISCVPLTKEYENLLVVQTFSKSRSMAGARLGFAIADSELIADLNRIKYSTNPYNINRLTLAAAGAALDENDYYRENCELIQQTREKTAAELKNLGFEVLPSKANFLFAKSDRIGGGELYRQLKARGVLVRHFDNPLIEDYNRITIGSSHQMRIFLEKVGEILQTANEGGGHRNA